jgi:predicted nucleotidyltransferase
MVAFGPGEAWDLPDLGSMRVELEEIFGRPVDIVEKGAVENPHRQRSIERDLTVLYAA